MSAEEVQTQDWKERAKKWPSLQKAVDLGDDYIEEGDGREERLLKSIYESPKLAELRGHPQMILDAIDDFSGMQDFLISIGYDKAKIFVKEIASRKPRVAVEIGGHVGYSAICFANAMRQARPGEKLQYWSLEMNPIYAAITMSLVDLAGLSDIVKVVTGAAAESLQRLKHEGALEHIDLLFIDHLEELYIPDLKTCESLGLLKSGACIMADNVVRPGAPEYRKYVRSHPDMSSTAVKGLIMPGEMEDEIEITVMK